MSKSTSASSSRKFAQVDTEEDAAVSRETSHRSRKSEFVNGTSNAPQQRARSSGRGSLLSAANYEDIERGVSNLGTRQEQKAREASRRDGDNRKRSESRGRSDSQSRGRSRGPAGGPGGANRSGRPLRLPAGTKAGPAPVDTTKYDKGPGISEASLAKIRNEKLKRRLEENESHARYAATSAAEAEMLQPLSRGTLEADPNSVAQTWQFTQRDVAENVQEGAKKKAFELKMEEFAPYSVDYTRNGRHLLLGGRKGHLALFDWHKFKLSTEIHVRETVRAVKFLHNESMFAVAQKKYVYIYDNQGIELHVLKHHIEPSVLDFLPYHYLLVSSGKDGFLRYQDVSIGNIVAEWRTKHGEAVAMRQNPQNAVMHLGHADGVVSLWTPNQSTAVVQMLCHKAPVQALAIAPNGHQMVTSGLDGKVRVWDMRTYKELHSYFTVRPAETIDISQTGMLALGYGPHIQVWKDALRQKQASPYMYEQLSGLDVSAARFCPYEDVLGVGHSEGFNSLIVPGSGEANFDSYEVNPFQTKKQRRETTVRSLLEKLQPDMITLDTRAFSVASAEDEKELAEEAAKGRKERERVVIDLEKKRAKGRNKDGNRLKLKKKNIIDAKAELYKELLVKREEDRKQKAAEAKAAETGGPVVRDALDRFGPGAR